MVNYQDICFLAFRTNVARCFAVEPVLVFVTALAGTKVFQLEAEIKRTSWKVKLGEISAAQLLKERTWVDLINKIL